MTTTPSTEQTVLRAPEQARSRATLARIFAAMERLLGEALFDDISMGQIIQEAGVSASSFYARFPSKDALIPALCDRYIETLQATASEIWSTVPADAGLEERARALVDERVHRYRKWKGLLRSLVTIGRTRPHLLDRAFQQRAEESGRGLIAFMRPVLDEVAHENPTDAVERGFYFISAICRERILFPKSPHASEVPIGDDAIVDELTRLLVCYLKASPGADGAC